ncbi:MAG: Rho termination factor N-terminal domain-containing protein [Pyrinomonadaceae bacterium]|nr:Rho termination factor N-terminal domain-containing protein [Pyrinomonadaceae bacterium]
MSEEISLKVPDEIEVEFVSQGNFEAELKPGEIVKTKSRKFADWLISNHNLEEVPTSAESLANELGKIKVGELVQKAEQLKIENPKSLKKDELVQAIVKASFPENNVGGAE